MILGLLVVAAAVKISLPLSAAQISAATRGQEPVDAIAYIQRASPPGPLFNSYNWGGYILWELYPKYLSFVDGRTDLFDNDLLVDYLAAWQGEPSYRDLFARWGIRTVLIEPQAPLADVLKADGWQSVYSDGSAIVLVGRVP